MTHVSIAVLSDGSLISSLVRLFKIFNQANSEAIKKQKEPIFNLHLAGNNAHIDLYEGAFSIMPDLNLETPFEADLIIIPALAGNIADCIKKNAAFVPWIKEKYYSGSTIACLCTSAFLLPGTGLINENNCVTDWFVARGFEDEFSEINLVAEKVVLGKQHIHTDGGAYCFINSLLEKLAGKKSAAACLMAFEKEFNRECQSLVTITHAKKGSNKMAKDRPLLHQSRFNDIITMDKFVEMFILNKSALKTNSKVDDARFIYEYIQNLGDKTSEKYVIPNLKMENKVREQRLANSKTFRKIFKNVNDL